MNRTFKLKPAADADLVSIFRYTSQEWGPNQAEQYLRRLSDTFTLLAERPLAGKTYDIVKPGLRGYPVQSHVIFYRPENHGVVILRILHKAMDYPGHV